WLARLFRKVIAVDVSRPHLRLASQAVDRAGLKNVELRIMNNIRKLSELPRFDCFISLIVLQHNPPPVSAFLLGPILKKLRPGGLGYLQIPTYMKDAVFNADRYLETASIDGQMEMHALPQAIVWRLAAESDCQLLDVREDNWCGSSIMISNSILLRKRSSGRI